MPVLLPDGPNGDEYFDLSHKLAGSETRLIELTDVMVVEFHNRILYYSIGDLCMLLGTIGSIILGVLWILSGIFSKKPSV